MVWGNSIPEATANAKTATEMHLEYSRRSNTAGRAGMKFTRGVMRSSRPL